MPPTTTRRDFLKDAALLTTAAAISQLAERAAPAQQAPSADAVPWYRRAYRWGQTNITEADIQTYDIPWWRQHWKRTELHGVIVNAGGIFAYYPSKFPLHYQPPQLNGRDLFGDLTKAAHEDGLFVLARMDSSKTHQAMYDAHPDWFACDASGQPYMDSGLFLTCVNSPYYDQFIPDIMREIIDRSHPDGFTDNIWHGIDRTRICYCQNCKTKFRAVAGKDLPTQHNWNDAVYRQWIEWNYARRIELWDFNNRVTREAGGKDCIWSGMNGAGVSGQASSFRDWRAICQRAEIVLLDNQSRSAGNTLAENIEAGKLIHGILGPEKLVPESMAMYQHGRPQYRLSAKSTAEARMWMIAGFAGGIQPWWHHVGAYDEDRRPYQTAEPVMKWHKTNEQYLINRKPLANVGIVWSQRNVDYFGRDNADELVDQPARGFTQALTRARIPHVPVHIDDVEKIGAQFSVLILANYGAMSDGQITAIRAFVQRGGSIVATGQTSLYNETGESRSDFALADLFGVSGAKPVTAAPRIRAAGAAGITDAHTYLRLTPELRAAAYGPKNGSEPAIAGKRHAALAGFDDTDVLPFGGTLSQLNVAPAAQTLLTFIPAFPATPPEISYMRTTHTQIPALIVNESQPGRVAYMAADLDRRYAADNLSDHGDLLANLVRWAGRDTIPLQVQGAGLIACELYQQPGRLLLHMVNLTSAGTWRAPMDELISVGPFSIRVRLPDGDRAASAKTLVAGTGAAIPITLDSGWVKLQLETLQAHELVLIES
jgi:hypothetical protein